MFIEHAMRTSNQSPRGATGEPGGTKIGRWQSEVESVGSGAPNPSGERGTGVFSPSGAACL